MSAAAASSAAPKSAGRKAKTAAAPAAAAVAAPVAAPAPAPVAAPAVVEHVAAPAVVEEVNLAARVSALAEKVNSLRTTMSSIYTEVKTLEKAVPRALKNAQKGRKGRKAAAAAAEGGEAKPKKPTIFEIPTQISDALCTFLGVAKGTQVSRAEVTSRVCKYAREKGLMEKQIIKHDAALRKLLSLKEADTLKITNLQTYLKPHYPAAAAKAAAKAAAAPKAAAATKTA